MAKLRYQPGTCLQTQENRKKLDKVGGPAEVQTKCLLSTGLKCYCYAYPFSFAQSQMYNHLLGYGTV
jgi:hypothetical protein